jgi:hypothetical protein
MPESPSVMDALARQVRTALEADDLSSYRALLDPDVTWGAPGAAGRAAGTVTRSSPGTNVDATPECRPRSPT